MGEVVIDTILVEGTPEEISVRRVEAPASFPLGFTTTVPTDMTDEFTTRDGASVARIEANFGGVPSPDAFFSFVALPVATDSAAASAAIREHAAELGGRLAQDRRIPWSLETYRIAGDASGFLALGQKDDRWFYFVARYPPEYGDGIGPRIGLILNRWRWPDGTALTSD